MDCFAPAYYPRFHCIADKCRHTCCAGWEIGIDEESLARYKRCEGAFGKRLADVIDEGEDGAVFRLLDGDRCPFLKEDGLCEMILTLGEGSLCQICREHPRFYNVFSHRTEVGLGLCCEEACRLILEETLPFSLVRWEDTEDEAYPPSEEEREVLLLRERFLEIATDRTRSVAQREEHILREAGISLPEVSAMLPVYRTLERMDCEWDTYLDAIALCATPEEASVSEVPREQLLAYFLYRHVSAAPNGYGAKVRGAFAILSLRVILAICAARKAGDPMRDFLDICRIYSAEIEYSEENTERLFEIIEEENNR